MKLSPLKSIHAKCFDCIYDEYDKGTRHEQTEACKSVECPLHAYRPLTSKTKLAIKQEKIANFTPKQLEQYKRKVEEAKIRFNKHS